MAIKLSKEEAQNRLVNLKKTATSVIERKGLAGQKARVALALDISGSMAGLFSQGTVQNAADKLLALALNFDDNGAADVFLFGAKDYAVGELTQENFYGYTDTIRKKYGLESSTHYAGVMKRIVDFYYPNASSTTTSKGFLGLFNSKKTSIQTTAPTGDPVYVLFLTDGDNFDKAAAEEVIREAAKLGIFWQFVGIGNASFDFLEKLDNMSGRYVDNANFFQLNDIDRVGEDELYNRILGEFPTWLREAKQKNII